MTEDHGRYNRRPPYLHHRSNEPEPLGDLLRRYANKRRWSHLIEPANTNGHRPTDPDPGLRRHG